MRVVTNFIFAATLVVSSNVAFGATDDSSIALSKMNVEQLIDGRHLRSVKEERAGNLGGLESAATMTANWKLLDDEVKAGRDKLIQVYKETNAIIRKIDTDKWTPAKIADELGIASKKKSMTKKELKKDGEYQFWRMYSKHYAKKMKKQRRAADTA